tara:strand:- start:22380 stop:22754 length:375 start_codon:yes stop_codon:yes gene_type:complete
MKNGYLNINDNIFQTLLAITDEEQNNGLMYIKPPTPVMSFVYSYPKINKFWMKNTPSPLDIVFCKNGQITQIHYGEPFSTRIIGDNEFSDLVIEFPIGTVHNMNIKIGNCVELIDLDLNKKNIF